MERSSRSCSHSGSRWTAPPMPWTSYRVLRASNPSPYMYSYVCLHPTARFTTSWAQVPRRSSRWTGTFGRSPIQLAGLEAAR